ncbi:ABC transporter substrate-binding protein [Mesorhizobium sp.]|uniref:ABC transporter substrate-binding protein n=1 Tax=Mesorhizobium sp. TaxID=1871066 RepID=UPI000FE62ED6|nr:ABC transporter substrate-binding protein [Mesorhizobium sp.]RWA57943.1 MAG: peptide ABC transporter substrate-binding protein [Mesorhizobium sp.]
MLINRRKVLGYGAGALGAATLGMPNLVRAQSSDLTIAYNVNLPSWDPTAGPSSVNPTIQGLYQSVFDQIILQKPDLSLDKGLITQWGWSDDRKKVMMTIRDGVTWHDGSPFTAEDLAWSLDRAGKPETGNPIQSIWKTATNFKTDGNKVTGDVVTFDPTYFKWMSFLTGYVLPKTYYQKVGPEGFEAKPIGTGPYMVDKFERNAFLRLKANPHYWGGKPAFQDVTIRFVTDTASRVAEIESGSSQVTLEVPYEEYDRLMATGNLAGSCKNVSDIGMVFFHDMDVMLDANVRKAAVMAIDKKLLVERLLRGYGRPLDTLQTPEYVGFDPSIKVEHNPQKAKELLAASGYSPDKPAKFVIQTTKGFKPKDYEMIQAIVGMWRKVGIEATIEVYEVAKHFELREAHKLAPAAFYNWGNSMGDPSSSTGFAMFGPSPGSSWKTADLDAKIGPLWGEMDEAKRIAGWKAVDKYIAEQAYVLPLVQYAQPILHSKKVNVVPHVSGALLPALMTPAA